jgi:hypothetical protein
MMPRIVHRGFSRPTLMIVVIGMLAGFPHGLLAMDFKVIGNQLILSGSVVGDELARTKRILADSPSVDTVILRDSPGGNVPTGYRMGELFRAKGLLTAVSGHCYSSCSRMFLGGKRRFFTDDFPPEYTHAGFHRHYDDHGQLLAKEVQTFGLKKWIIKYSDGKADPALVDRWINIPVNIGMIHFYDPDLLKREGASTFMCQGTEPMARSVLGCEPIRKSALDLGIITSLAIVKSNDQAEVRAMLGERPKASGCAAIDDIGKVPVTDENGRQDYRRFLAAALPRAIAVSPDAKFWAWRSGVFDAMAQAMERCSQRSNQACKFYAVDDDVVWTMD